MTTRPSIGCRGSCNQGRSICKTPETCFARREAKDSALDSLIMPMEYEDTKDYEKGPMFPAPLPKSRVYVVRGAVIIALIVAALTLASAG